MFEILIQLHKKGGSSTTVQSYKPTEQEVRLQKQAADYSEAVAPNALWLNNVARNVLEDSLGTIQVDYNSLNQNAQNQIANAQSGVQALQNGELPAAYQQNMENSIKSGVENTMGSMINSLGQRGVLNSSVTNTANKQIADSAANTMAEQYSNNISALNGLYGQQASLAGQGITTAAAAQEAAQSPALNLWNASLGLNAGGTGTALNAVSGQGTSTTTTSTRGGGSVLGSLGSGLFSGAMSSYGTLWCFADDVKVRTPEGDKNIRNIHEGDIVISRDADGNDIEDEVIETLEPHYSDVYVVSTLGSNNAKGYVSTTLTQPLMLEDGTYKYVEILRIGDKLMGGGKVIGVGYSGERKIYDLKLKQGGDYYANGLVAKGATEEW